MSNMHRLIWLDQRIRALTYPNRNTLAEKFEISVRQAQRDIDYLKNSLEAPIQYDAKRRGYYYGDEHYVLPNVYINDIQKKMLKFLAYRYENYTQTPKVAQMSELFKRLTGEAETDDEIPIFDLGKPIVQSYYGLYNAIQSKNKIKLHYRDAYKGDIELVLHPYRLFYKYKVDHLAGYHQEKQEWTAVRLDRIQKWEVLAEKYEPRRDFDRRKYGSFIEKEPYRARIQFASPWELQEEKGIHIKHLENLVYEAEFFDIHEFVNRLLCTGNWETVLSPKWLKDKLVKRCREIMEKMGEKN